MEGSGEGGVLLSGWWVEQLLVLSIKTKSIIVPTTMVIVSEKY